MQKKQKTNKQTNTNKTDSLPDNISQLNKAQTNQPCNI